MLVLETIAKIRRAYFVQQKTIKAISHELRVSRKVVRKVLRSEATAFHYERGEQPLPRIGPWREAAYQFDWSHEVVLINGTTVTVKMAHVRLCRSRMLFARAYPRETQGRRIRRRVRRA